VLFYDLIVV